MYVASLELCKQLFELSGWEDCYWLYCLTCGDIRNIGSKLPDDGKTHESVPAYGLGFLLRKLQAIDDPDNGNPENIYVELTVIKGYSTATSVRGITRVDAEQPHQRQLPSCDADTPEDATAKLAIELFKAGILKKGVEG